MRIRNQEGVMNTRANESAIIFTVSSKVATDIMREFMRRGRKVYQSMEIDYNPDLHQVKGIQNPDITPNNPWVALIVWIYPFKYAEVVNFFYRSMQNLTSMGRAFDLNNN
jgi:hypothetical protein